MAHFKNRKIISMKRTTFLKTLGLIGASLGTAHELFAKDESPVLLADTSYLKDKMNQIPKYEFDSNSPDNSLRQKINYQKKHAVRLTEDIIKLLETDAYSSGRKYMVGDYILFGMTSTIKEKPNEMVEVDFKFTSFHEDEIGNIYDIEEEKPGSGAPLIFLKKLRNYEKNFIT